MLKTIKILILITILCLSACQSQIGKDKYLVILQAGIETKEGMARAIHALLYSQELLENGYDVVLLFDGAGTEWVNEWNNPTSQNKLKPGYEELKKAGVTQVICDYCSIAFKAREHIEGKNLPLAAEYQGHPSIVKYIKQNYKVLIL